MVSVVDGGKGLGLGLGFGGGEMAATEIEEGEACADQNDIDPDVALAYLDEKLEHVLGHFQKDFEGGVSAENLGSKFGGYGSFLPTYQRSPVWSHSKNPLKVQNDNASKSPTNVPLEGAHSNFVSSSASLSVKHGSTPLGMATLPAPSVSYVDGVKQEVVKPLNNFENLSDSQSDQKTFRVRIKMGSDNLPTKKNADIYSGLGLDVSPTSSSEEGPIDGESACELRNSPEVSPTSILQIMTSSPLHGRPLLSPLHDDLIRLADKKMLLQVNSSAPNSHKGSLLSVNGSKTHRSDKKVGEKKLTSSEKVITVDLKNNNVKDNRTGVNVLLKKETDVDSSVCDDLVSNASKITSSDKVVTVDLKKNNIKNNKNGVNVLLKKETDVDNSVCDELVTNASRLPHLSNSYHSVADTAKDTARPAKISRIVNKGGIKEESIFNVTKDELHESVSIHKYGFVGKSNNKAVSAMKVSELKKTDSYDDRNGYPEKGDFKFERIDVLSKVHTDMSNVRKGFVPDLMDHANHKSGQKSVFSVDDDMKVSSGKENSSSGCKRKSKKNQSHVTQIVTDMRNANTKMDGISAPKSRKSANLSVCMSSSEADDCKQGTGKAKDRYKEFFGDLELEDNDIVEDIPSVDKAANLAVFGKGNGECTSVSKDRTTTKKIDQASTSEAYTRRSTSHVPPTGNRLISDAAAPVAPLVKEDWVCCDKCQKWRLLPAGKGPDSLPKTWVCSMLDWLDGMNRCTFSEEETTKAVLALHQTFASGLAPAPVYEGQSSQKRYSNAASSALVGALHVDQSLQDIGGKKKHGFGDLSNASDQYGSSPYSNSKKKIPQASVKNQIIHGENRSTLNEVDFQVPWQSSGLVEQKRKHKRKERSETFANAGAGNVQSDTTSDIKSSKIRNKRENSQESYKSSKKLKMSGVHIDGDGKSDNGAAALRVGRSSGSILSVNETGKHQHKNDLPKESKVVVRSSGDVKRKINKGQEAQLGTTSRSFEGHRVENHRDIVEELSENNHRKGMKQRLSKSGRYDSSMSKESGGIDKKGRSLENQQGVNLEKNLFCRNLDAVDLVKKVAGSTQPPVAATSSSSQVSGSHKSKANLKEVKCSPVESGSLSPLRTSNQDILLSTRREHGGKNNSKETVILATSSPKNCSDGEDCIGIDQSKMIQKNLTTNSINQGCAGSSMLDLPDNNQSNMPRTAMAESATHHVTDVLQSDQYPCKRLISNDESGKKIQHQNIGSSRKCGKGSSSRCKDKSCGSRSDSENGNLKPSDFYGHVDHLCQGQDLKARSKLQEKFTLDSEKVEKTVFLNKDPVASPFTDFGKIEAQSSQVSLASSDIRQVVSNHESKQNLPIDCTTEKDLKMFPSDKTYRVDISGKGKSHLLPPSGRSQNEMSRWPQPINAIPKDSGVNVSAASTSDGDTSKTAKQIKKSENQSGNGMTPVNPQNPIDSHKGRDIDASNTIRRDSSSQAATNALKEAKDLKHLADRYKNSGSTLDSTGLYFQAALKFLYGASLLESCNRENAKHGEILQSMQIYGDTAKLCEFCAHEYEKSKDMASAALAYKCVEVAYLRVVNTARSNAIKDQLELQTTLQIVLPGESPSSSASDVENLNNPAMVEKTTLSQGVNSAQIANNHALPTRNRPNFSRLLNFAQYVNLAMEASRKSRIAFTAANSMEDTKYQENMSSVKKALDFHFHDVEGLLLLVRLAMEAISH